MLNVTELVCNSWLRSASHELLLLAPLHAATFQVALMSGVTEAGLQKMLADPENKDSTVHLNKLLRFLTVRPVKEQDRGGIALVGGAHDPALDGEYNGRWARCAWLAAAHVHPQSSCSHWSAVVHAGAHLEGTWLGTR